MTSVNDRIRVLNAVTERVLDEMERHGWRKLNLEAGHGYGPVRYDRPQPWDVAHGTCLAWATYAAEILPGGRVFWLPPSGYHTVLELDGRYYDALAPEGVDDFHDLPFVLAARQRHRW